jgi:hypothetical protein
LSYGLVGWAGSAVCRWREVGMNYDENPETEEREFDREERMWETAKLLVDIAVKTQMTIYDVDLETARGWVYRAVVATAERD